MTKNLMVCSTSSISELPEDLVLKILSFLSLKHVVVTSLLSKNWRFLWTRVSKLEFDAGDLKNPARFESLINKSLFAHETYVLETLCFKLYGFRWNKGIGPCIRTALHHHQCHLRELEIDGGVVHTLLPPELFTCKTLVVLKLKGSVTDVAEPLTTVCLLSLKTLHINRSSLFDFGSLQLLLSSCNSLTDLVAIRKSGYHFVEYDVSWCKTLVSLKLEGLKNISSSSAVCLPFLKTLHVARMESFNNESKSRLLSICPLLSDLTLGEETSDVILNLDISMPFLKRVSIITQVKRSSTHLCSLMDNCVRKLASIAPSFRYFNVEEGWYYMYFIHFHLNVKFRDPSKLEDVFHQIEHLELCIYERTGEMLEVLLQRSTKLVALKLKNDYGLAPLNRWDPPSCVPECLLYSLEVLEWRGYTGRVGDRDVASYLMNHALCLKTAKIFSESRDVQDKRRILKNFASMPRVSKSCELLLS